MKLRLKKRLSPLVFAIGRSLSHHLPPPQLPLVPYYHVISDERLPHIENLYPVRTLAEFKRDVEVLLKRFRFISLPELLDSLNLGRTLPAASMLMTFDDGFREIYDVVAPVLKEKGIPATVFLNPAFLGNKGLAFHNKVSLLLARIKSGRSECSEEKALALLRKSRGNFTSLIEGVQALTHRDEQVLDRLIETFGIDLGAFLRSSKPYLDSGQVNSLLRLGFTFGGHSLDHPVYGDLSASEQIFQTVESVRLVREEFSLTYSAFAFPNGDRGIAEKLFDEVYEKHCLEVTFGTTGFSRSPFPRHFQRFSMEYEAVPAEEVLSRFHLRNWYQRCTKW